MAKIQVGDTFGEWTVIAFDKYDKKSERNWWICQCSCGKVKSVNSAILLRGQSKSCGHNHKLEIGKWSYERSVHRLFPELSQEDYVSLYSRHKSIIRRCYNPSYKEYQNYGGRGISVCKEWTDKDNGLWNFIAWSLANGYSKDLTVDRIDNNGNYCPQNCRWVTREVQTINRRPKKCYIVIDPITWCKFTFYSLRATNIFISDKQVNFTQSCQKRICGEYISYKGFLIKVLERNGDNEYVHCSIQNR